MNHRLLGLLPMALTAATLPAQLAGAYVVGPAGNYANIAAAIAALTTTGVSGPVTFLVTANDAGPWTLPAFPGQGPANPVVFDGQGSVALSGTQPMLTLNGCASVTFSGFSGTFGSTANTFVIAGSTADCVFTNCNFQATVATSGFALFNFTGGSGCRIEDSTFGGSYEALNSGVGNATTTVQRCRITGGGWWIMRLAGTDFTLVNNQITGTSNYGISCGISGTPTSAANLKIWHNSIFIAHPAAGSQYCSLRWYSNATGTEVVDNICVDTYPSLTTSVYNMWCSGSYRPALMDFNCLWSNQPGYFPVAASGNRTFAQWQGLGFDLHSIAADPAFVAPTAPTPDLHLQAGSPCSTAGTTLVTVPGDFFFAPRTPPVSMGAHEEDSGAVYAVFGAGCVGSAGVPSNTASPALQIGGTATLTFGNLPPANLAVVVLGLSNTVSGFGPLPVDLTTLGAPGCSLRVSVDATLAIVGTGGIATLPFPVPNQPSLVGFAFYTQAAAIDPPQNALGLSLSDAAAVVVGL